MDKAVRKKTHPGEMVVVYRLEAGGNNPTQTPIVRARTTDGPQCTATVY
eukprot:SAG22_NODE_18334_length_289_cov_0.684211_1_plen_49_part_10